MIRNSVEVEVMKDSVTERILMKRFEEVNVNFRTTWDLYLKFYTVFLTFDIAAFAWVYGKDFNPQHRWPVSVAFIFQKVLVAITSGSIARYSKTVMAKILGILNQLADLANQRGESIDRARVLGVDLPTSIAIWGGLANCAGVSVLGVIWALWWWIL
jgi:hypothetical protein